MNIFNWTTKSKCFGHLVYQTLWVTINSENTGLVRLAPLVGDLGDLNYTRCCTRILYWYLFSGYTDTAYVEES